MNRWHGRTVCSVLAVALLGIEMAENSVTFVGDVNIWSFVHKVYLFILGLHYAHDIFHQLAKWSNPQVEAKLPVPNLKNFKENLKLSCAHRLRSSTCAGENKLHGRERLWNALWRMRVVCHQLPLSVLILFAVFHSVAGTYFFYTLTGFVRQNNIKEAGWYTYIITRIDTLSIAVIFLWLRWALIFYSYEAKAFRRREQLWRRVFCIRWKYPVQCTLALSMLQMGLTVVKLVDGVPFLKTEALHTSVMQATWLVQVLLVTSVTFLSCFPHAVCQVTAIALSFVGFAVLSATPAEIHAELYGILYLFVPSALATAAMLYHTLFSPWLVQELIWTKLFAQLLNLLFFAIMLAVLLSEKRAFVKYVVHEPFSS